MIDRWQSKTKQTAMALWIAAASSCVQDDEGSIEVRFSGQSGAASQIFLDRGELKLVDVRFEPADTADRFGEFAEIVARSDDPGIARVHRTVLTDTWAITATDAGTTHITFHVRNATRDIEVEVGTP